MYSSTLSLTSALNGVGGESHDPAALPPGKIRYPLYRRLGGPQCRSRLVRKSSLTSGFDPRTVQLVASRYTDWATPAQTRKHDAQNVHLNFCIVMNDLLGNSCELFQWTIGWVNVRICFTSSYLFCHKQTVRFVYPTELYWLRNTHEGNAECHIIRISFDYT